MEATTRLAQKRRRAKKNAQWSAKRAIEKALRLQVDGVGFAFIEVLSELLRGWGEIRMVLFALLVIVIARGYPDGLVGICHAAGERLAEDSARSLRVPAFTCGAAAGKDPVLT